MICGKCTFVQKKTYTDEHSNIHIIWNCSETLRLVFAQVIYSDKFLQQLRDKVLHADLFYKMRILPLGKSVYELKHVEVLHERKSKKCKKYRIRMKPLAEY